MFKCDLCEKNLKNAGSYTKHRKTCEEIDKIKNEVIDLYVNELWSFREIEKKYNIGSQAINKILGNKKRNLSDSIKIAHKKYPNSFILNDKAKDKIRQHRLRYIRENPHKTSWRTNQISYPEKLFQDKLINLGWDKKYSIHREYSFFPYYIDFAFLNEKIAVEIDGSQHLLPERKNKDDAKDSKLISNGWSVFRIAENKIKKDIDNVFLELEKLLNNNIQPTIHSVGIVCESKKYVKKNREKNGFTKKQFDNHIKQRKIIRPDIETLKIEIKECGYVGTGKKYGVSDNAIRKWLKFYEKRENIK